jgi:hypothetical protein
MAAAVVAEVIFWLALTVVLEVARPVITLVQVAQYLVKEIAVAMAAAPTAAEQVVAERVL